MKIPKEIECRLRTRGGIEGLIKSLPNEKNLRKAERVFNALGDSIRIKILFLLHHQDLCVCIIKEICHTSDSRLSYHLSVLKDAGLIESRDDGNWLIYSLTKDGRKVTKFIWNLMKEKQFLNEL
ncbi:MAG: metalloregulator ArsR/SmtB family transcription factor [Thermoplasmata archaeon]